MTPLGHHAGAFHAARLRLVVGSVALAATLAFAGPARADDAAAVGKITLLNRKAVDAYQHLEFETAERLLNEALDQSERAGLTQHPIRARTFVTLGIVSIGGLKQREKAVKYFRKALQIQPEVRLNPGLANPEIQAAFDDAVAGLGTGGDDMPPDKALVHEPVRTGQSKQPVMISVVPHKELEATSVVLRYRAATSSSFMDVPMTKAATGAYEAAIPASATDGEQVAYFIEARRGNGSVVVGRGTAVDPIVVALARPVEAVAATPHVESARRTESDKKIFFALAGGTGLGYSSGNGEATRSAVTTPGVGWTHSGQLAPELGYFFSPQLMFGVQMRLQLLRDANEYHLGADAKPGECGGDGICSPASGAIAALLKLTWFLTESNAVFQPYLALSAGAGTIRNVSSVKADTCGTGTQACIDTLAGGPALVGPGFGFRLVVSDAVGIVAGINGLIGVPTFAATADMNIGVAFQL